MARGAKLAHHFSALLPLMLLLLLLQILLLLLVLLLVGKLQEFPLGSNNDGGGDDDDDDRDDDDDDLFERFFLLLFGFVASDFIGTKANISFAKKWHLSLCTLDRRRANAAKNMDAFLSVNIFVWISTGRLLISVIGGAFHLSCSKPQ